MNESVNESVSAVGVCRAAPGFAQVYLLNNNLDRVWHIIIAASSEIPSEGS